MQSLISALSNSDCTEVSFANDITTTEQIVIVKDVVVDLNSHVFDIDVLEGFTVSSGIVSISNGTIRSNKDDPITAAGFNVNLTLGPSLDIATEGCSLAVKHRAKVHIDGAHITCQSPDHSAVFVEGYGLAADNTYLEMRSGSISSATQTAVAVTKRALFNLINGYIECNAPEENINNAATVYIDGRGAKFQMFNGELYSKYVTTIVISHQGDVTIYDGTVHTDSRQEPAIFIIGNSALLIQSGHIHTSKSDVIIIQNGEEPAPTHVVITGGTFTAGGTVAADNSKSCIVVMQGDVEPYVSVSGGRFKGKFDTKYLADDVTYEIDSDGYLVVIPSNAQPDETSEPVSESTSEIQDEPASNSEPSADPEVPQHSSAVRGGVIEKPTHVYGAPSTKFSIDNIIGAVNIVKSDIINSKGMNFTLIEYVLPGVGRRASGYVISSAITKGGDR